MSEPLTRPLDEIDRALLELLVDDGRLSINDLAQRTNISRATAYSRFDRLRQDGVITGFTATVDSAKIGLPITALILVNVEQHEWRAAREQVAELPGLEYLAFTSGGFDMVLLVRVPDIAALRDVVLVQLHGMAHVKSTQTIFVLDEQRQSVRPASFTRPTKRPRVVRSR